MRKKVYKPKASEIKLLKSGCPFPQRKKLRLEGFNYNACGAYFITICTHNKKCMLSSIVGAIHESPETKLTEYGKSVETVIQNIPDRYHAIIDKYTIMPNHIHLIIVLQSDEDPRAIRESPLLGRSCISKIVGYIKMNSSKEIHRFDNSSPIWQRGFHDHIIRNHTDYKTIAKYIQENPIKWHSDCFYTEE